MWSKLTGLAFIEAALIWWLTRPIPTHAVIYDPLKEASPAWPLTFQIEAYVSMLGVIIIPAFAYWLYRRSSQA